MAQRTQEEIVDRIRERQGGDPFGFETGELLGCLDFEHAKPFLKQTATADDWKQDPSDVEAVVERMREYMKFAWEKANGCRGISANRSVQHYQAWLWLAGNEELLAKVNELFEDYCYYGKKILRAISEAYGWDWRALDDGRWTNYEDSPGVTADEACR